jgi:hypothetical protein
MDEGSDFRSDEFAGFPEPPPPGRGPRRRVHPLTLAAVAVAGAAIGVAAVMIADFSTSSTAAAGSTPSDTPASQAPSGGGAYPGGGPASLSPLTGNPSGLRMMITGKVTAVSANSITIGGNGPSVTAKIAKATGFTGTADSIGGVKVGDQVSATLAGPSASSLTATAIEDLGLPRSRVANSRVEQTKGALGVVTPRAPEFHSNET